MQEPAIDETPIFHALTGRASDPVERFRGDPLDAPLPASSAMNRVLLHAVPTDHARHRAVHRARHAVGGDPEPDGPAERPEHDPGDRGGRHRAVRAVGENGEGGPPSGPSADPVVTGA